jgi:hypothetical protein
MEYKIPEFPLRCKEFLEGKLISKKILKINKLRTYVNVLTFLDITAGNGKYIPMMQIWEEGE